MTANQAVEQIDKAFNAVLELRYPDDNYTDSENKILDKALNQLTYAMENVVKVS